ncbi:MAG: T9SS type A sorting domain-containing protein [Bacteroidota bacterium]
MKTKHFFIIAILASINNMFPQDGTLDPSFGGDGFVTTNFPGSPDQSYAIVQQDDGKIVASGFSGYGDIHILSRYMPDGSLDTSFGTDGKVMNDFNVVPPPFTYFSSIDQQADGKLVTGSSHRLSGGNLDFFLVRYLTNGQLDTSFGDNGVVSTDFGVDYLSAIAVLPDGKILAGGWSEQGGSTFVMLTKYLPNGDLDNSFGTDGIVTTYLHSISSIVFPFMELPDGKVLVAGRGTNGFLTFHRYLSNGTLDPDFGTDGILQASVASANLYGSVTIKDNGKMVAALVLGQSNVKVMQFLEDGSLDPSFGTNGMTDIEIPLFFPYKILLDDNENILVSGKIFGFEVSTYYLLRYNSNGILDTSFGDNGSSALGFESTTMSFQDDGKILVTGHTYWYNGTVNFVVVRFQNGILRTTDIGLPEFVVSPNPSQDEFIIRSDRYLENIPYGITDISGKVIQTGFLEGIKAIIDLSDAMNGVYFLKLPGTTLKLLKQ